MLHRASAAKASTDARSRRLQPLSSLSCEIYFSRGNSRGVTSNDKIINADNIQVSTKSSALLLGNGDLHGQEVDCLTDIHHASFDQWAFELEAGFNLCLFGWGSKKQIMFEFMHHMNLTRSNMHIITLNGHNTTFEFRDLFHCIASTIPALPTDCCTRGLQSTEMLSAILWWLSDHPPDCITVIHINSIDGIAVNKPTSQSLLCRLAASPHFRVIASADSLYFPLLWDVASTSELNWLFHDCTTFKSYDVEIGGCGQATILEKATELLGLSQPDVKGRAGVLYVLRSLTQSAQRLFRLLLVEILSIDGDAAKEKGNLKSLTLRVNPPQTQLSLLGGRVDVGSAIEWLTLYQKAVSLFIATNESSFKALLKEFVDHQIISTQINSTGTELISLPYDRSELEILLEELGDQN